jgi:hypothetical protein
MSTKNSASKITRGFVTVRRRTTTTYLHFLCVLNMNGEMLLIRFNGCVLTVASIGNLMIMA